MGVAGKQALNGQSRTLEIVQAVKSSKSPGGKETFY